MLSLIDSIAVAISQVAVSSHTCKYRPEIGISLTPHGIVSCVSELPVGTTARRGISQRDRIWLWVALIWETTDTGNVTILFTPGAKSDRATGVFGTYWKAVVTIVTKRESNKRKQGLCI